MLVVGRCRDIAKTAWFVEKFSIDLESSINLHRTAALCGWGFHQPYK